MEGASSLWACDSEGVEDDGEAFEEEQEEFEVDVAVAVAVADADADADAAALTGRGFLQSLPSSEPEDRLCIPTTVGGGSAVSGRVECDLRGKGEGFARRDDGWRWWWLWLWLEGSVVWKKAAKVGQKRGRSLLMTAQHWCSAAQGLAVPDPASPSPYR